MNSYKWALSIALLGALILSACQPVMPVEVDTPVPKPTESADKVLLVLRQIQRPINEQRMETDEVLVMMQILEEAGFDVDTASASNRKFYHGDEILYPDMALTDVSIDDYKGMAIPCLCTHEYSGKPEEVEIARQFAAAGKPVAAQRRSVRILAEAGALDGKRYSFESDASYSPSFYEGVYDGDGVVQDGNIITSSYCPGYSEADQTAELMQTFITVLNQ